VSILLIMALAVGLQAPAEPGERPHLDPKIREPRRVKASPPEYPPDAVKAGMHGPVIVECTVGIDGKVTNAIATEGDPPLSDAAVAAVRKWRYEPLLLNGKPKEFVLTVTVHFQLQRVTVEGLCESLRSRYEAVRESAATLLGYVRPGARVSPGDVAQATRQLKALLDREQSQRVRTAAEAALDRLSAQ